MEKHEMGDEQREKFIDRTIQTLRMSHEEPYGARTALTNQGRHAVEPVLEQYEGEQNTVAAGRLSDVLEKIAVRGCFDMVPTLLSWKGRNTSLAYRDESLAYKSETTLVNILTLLNDDELGKFFLSILSAADEDNSLAPAATHILSDVFPVRMERLDVLSDTLLGKFADGDRDDAVVDSLTNVSIREAMQDQKLTDSVIELLAETMAERVPEMAEHLIERLNYLEHPNSIVCSALTAFRHPPVDELIQAGLSAPDSDLSALGSVLAGIGEPALDVLTYTFEEGVRQLGQKASLLTMMGLFIPKTRQETNDPIKQAEQERMEKKLRKFWLDHGASTLVEAQKLEARGGPRAHSGERLRERAENFDRMMNGL
ncbi:MAG: hypothetical protein ABH851_06120 [Methanobacteriota archaeon]